MKKNKLYGEEATFRPFTLANRASVRFCRFEPTQDEGQVFVRFRSEKGIVLEEMLDTQEAINQIVLLLTQGFEESYDADSGGPTRNLLDLCGEIELTSPCTYLN